MKQVTLNTGAQKSFVEAHLEASAYIGGVGSGKTFSGILKGLLLSQQPLAPGAMYGPRGAIGASSNPVLKRIVLPQFFELMDGTGLWKTGRRTTSYVKSEYLARLIANCGCSDPHACDHESQIYLVTLDDPDEIRGMELSWFFIDEGRNTTKAAWDVLWGRLRQREYEHEAWVCSTSNGYDWQYDYFFPESPNHISGAEMFVAKTTDNPHLPDDYIDRLKAVYHGRFFRQEVMGEFVGMTEGAVFFEWDPAVGVGKVPYLPALELYSEWDFGMADLNVVLFFQLDYKKWLPDPARPNDAMYLPVKRYVGALEGNNRTSGEWAKVFTTYSMERFARMPHESYGDPAGRQRHQVSGTSVIEDLRQHGVRIIPAQKIGLDYPFRIMNSMMADGRFLVDQTHCERLAQALASHKWPMNAAGNRTQNTPVHDWSSHYCDAARYGTIMTIPMGPVAATKPQVRPYQPNEVGYVVQQILNPPKPGRWIGRSGTPPKPDWNPGVLAPRES